MNTQTWNKVKGILDACLDLEPAARSAYLDDACSGAPALRIEVESLLASHDQAGDFMARPILRESFVGERLGHWRIIGDIGEGGMSRVCLAERADGQFQQLAAIKILKRGMDTDLILRHFQMERQILAGMRHPNVARLLDGGVTPGGRPYFVMEHIEGERIDEYAKARKLGIGDLLKLFQQVCSAVHYAHQRLVVHRDIKPGNILVTSDGSVKLLDFGIATILSAEPSLGTLTADQMLTPEYASPEQLRGEGVTTSSDVYSLGVLLYRLLTGQNPYQLPRTSPGDIARSICELDAKAPSSVASREIRPALAGDLDNIVFKALEKDPQRRYASVEQLSEDIQRHRENRPVLARAQTWRYRASKAVLRNMLAMSAATLMVLLLVGGLAATLWQARVAGIERRRAEDQFFETRQLANSLLFEVHDAIKDLPGSTQARAFIIQRSLKYLDRISAASPENAALRLELAEGYKRLGDVQGRANGANLGEYASATKSYRKAIALLQTKPDLGLDSTTDRKRRSLLATIQLRLGDYTNTTLAVQELEALERSAKNDATISVDLAEGYAAMADILVDQRDLPQALAYRLKELSLQKQILERNPNDIQNTRNYALASKKLGALLWKMQRPEEAMAHYQSALHLEEGWSALAPSSIEAKMAISFSHSDIGFLLREGGNLPGSLAHYKTAVKIREEAVAADPDNARAKLSLISAYWRTATVSTAAGDTRTSFSLLRKAVDMLAQIKNPAPGSARNRIELANIYSVYGESYQAIGNRAAARSWYEKAKKLLTDLSHAGELDANGADRLQSVEQALK